MSDLLSRNDVLNILFKRLSNISGVSYSFKGGFIVSNFFFCNNSRFTKDLDMSVVSDMDFNKIAEEVTPILDELKEKGQIFKYAVKAPKVTDTRNMSGYIKLYRKVNDNLPAYVFCGVDISIQDLSYGIIKIKGDLNVFSPERMIADKISVMYSNKKTILRRNRDMYDLYLFNLFNFTVDYSLLLKCLKKRKVRISEISTFEMLISNAEESSEVISSLNELLANKDRVSEEWILLNDVTPVKIINSVLYVLSVIRS